MIWILVAVLLSGQASGYCPRSCSCNNEKLWVHCSNSKLSLIPFNLNPHITSFTMRNSSIISLVNDTGFQFYEALLELDLSYNFIHSIGNGKFYKQVNLQQMKLSHNRLEHLGSESLLGLSKLTHLYLDHNHLHHLPEHLLDPCPNLVQLHLNHNQILTIHETSFAGGQLLKQVYLQFNQLQSPPAIRSLLSDLNLAHNQLSTLSWCNSSTNWNIAHLNLSNVGLKHLMVCEDANLSSVETLDISGNYLDLREMTLRAMPNLRDLRMGQENITSIEYSFFEGLSRLKHLEIADCPHLTKLKPGVLASLKELNTLVISRNPKLTSLPVGLSSAANGQSMTLELSGNGLKAIHEESFPWGVISSINLADNPLLCDCSSAWMASTFRNIGRVEAVCAFPLELTGRRVVDLAGRGLQCETFGPMEVSLISVCLVVASLSMGIVAFLCYRHRRKSGMGPTVSDFTLPPYHLQQGQHPDDLQQYKMFGVGGEVLYNTWQQEADQDQEKAGPEVAGWCYLDHKTSTLSCPCPQQSIYQQDTNRSLPSSNNSSTDNSVTSTTSSGSRQTPCLVRSQQGPTVLPEYSEVVPQNDICKATNKNQVRGLSTFHRSHRSGPEFSNNIQAKHMTLNPQKIQLDIQSMVTGTMMPSRTTPAHQLHQYEVPYTGAGQTGPRGAMVVDRPISLVTEELKARDQHEVVEGDYGCYVATGGSGETWSTAMLNGDDLILSRMTGSRKVKQSLRDSICNYLSDRNI